MTAASGSFIKCKHRAEGNLKKKTHQQKKTTEKGVCKRYEITYENAKQQHSV